MIVLGYGARHDSFLCFFARLDDLIGMSSLHVVEIKLYFKVFAIINLIVVLDTFDILQSNLIFGIVLNRNLIHQHIDGSNLAFIQFLLNFVGCFVNDGRILHQLIAGFHELLYLRLVSFHDMSARAYICFTAIVVANG